MTKGNELPTSIPVDDVPAPPDYSEHPVNKPAIQPQVVVPVPAAGKRITTPLSEVDSVIEEVFGHRWGQGPPPPYGLDNL